MKDNAVAHLDAGEAASEIESRKNASDLSEKIKARYGENKRITRVPRGITGSSTGREPIR